MSGHDMKIAREASPATQALAACLKTAVPGMKMPAATFAKTIEQMLAEKGFHIVKLDETRP